MKWLRQASSEYLKDRACELIKEGNVLKALKCLIVLEERKPNGTTKDSASPTT